MCLSRRRCIRFGCPLARRPTARPPWPGLNLRVQGGVTISNLQVPAGVLIRLEVQPGPDSRGLRVWMSEHRHQAAEPAGSGPRLSLNPALGKPQSRWSRDYPSMSPQLLTFATKKLSTRADGQVEDAASFFCPRIFYRAVRRVGPVIPSQPGSGEY